MKKEYLVSIGSKISRLEIKKVTNYREFLKDEELVLQLIENSNSFYHNLSAKEKAKPEYILNFMKIKIKKIRDI